MMLLQGGDDLSAVALRRLAVRLPIVPGLRVHHRFGVEHAGIEIVRMIAATPAHGLREGFVELGAVGLGIWRVARRKRLDPFALFGRGVILQRLGALQRLPGRRHRVLGHRQVDVGAKRKRDAPPAHGAIGIEPRAFAERADRFGMVEAEHQVDALIEQHLGLRVAGA